MEDSGRNRTPDKLPRGERERLFAACDRYLRRLVEVMQPAYVIGVGKFAEERAQQALSELDVQIATIPHPSPTNPAANRGWLPLVDEALRPLGIKF
jgi:single-strand selective monofunctional uracil DNA glycosylase